MSADVLQFRSEPIDTPTPPSAPAFAEPQGIRLVLNLDATSAEQLRLSTVVSNHAVKRPYSRRLQQVFWDTPDFRLGRSGIALALQTAGQKTIQIVQTIRDIQTGGRLGADNQTQIAGTRPDLVRLALTAGSDPLLVSSLDPANIIPLFAIEFRRTLWTIAWGDTSLSLALDQGAITAPQGDYPIQQAALTHLSGPVLGLYDYARSLSRSLPLTLARLLPAQEGYRLASAEDWWPPAGKPALSPTMTVRDGILAIGQAATALLRGEVEALVQSQQPERIHQTRVAIRRLRSVLSVFGPVLPPLSRRVLGRELNALASQLGGAREWDVFLAETLGPMEDTLPQEHHLPGLRLTAQVLREQAAHRARIAVAEETGTKLRLSSGFMDLSLRLATWFDARLWPEAPSIDAQFWLDQPLISFARELLQKRHKKLLKDAQGLVDPQPDELHALRIDAKKLRYTAEFFTRLFPAKPAKRYLVALAEVQDILGVINDAAMSRELVRQLCASGESEDRHAAGLITGWTAAQAAAARRHFADSWGKFTAAKRFWKAT